MDMIPFLAHIFSHMHQKVYERNQEYFSSKPNSILKLSFQIKDDLYSFNIMVLRKHSNTSILQ